MPSEIFRVVVEGHGFHSEVVRGKWFTFVRGQVVGSQRTTINDSFRFTHEGI